MDNVDKDLLKEIADMNETPKGAYNIRKNKSLVEKGDERCQVVL